MLRRDFLKFQGAFLCCWSCPARGCNGVSKGSATPDTAVATGDTFRCHQGSSGAIGWHVPLCETRPGLSSPTCALWRTLRAQPTPTQRWCALLRMCLEAGAARVLVLDYAFRSGQDSLVTSSILSACDGVREGLCHNLTHDLHYREITLEGQGACTPMPSCATFWTRMCS